MRRINYKISIVIIVYSLLLTFVFVLGFTYFQYSAKKIDTEFDDIYVYPLDEEEFISAYREDFQILNSENIIKSSYQYQTYANEALSHMVPFIILFCLFLIGSSFLLWYVLNLLQRKHTSIISSQFLNIEIDGSYDFQDDHLNAAYSQIRQSFQNHLNDYKRLNSYLSHEQKNALAILRTTMEVHHQAEYLPQLDYISNSIDDILTLSEHGDEHAFSVVDVTLCCAMVCDLYRRSYPLLNFDFDLDHDTEILGKERWIFRAVSNLIDNAIKYGEQKPIDVTVTHEHHSVIICVQDHGVGIDEKQLTDIFNYHYRISELHRNGYGIGLSLVAHVCDLCGGYAYVESTLHRGSTFYLSFPAYIEA